MAISKYFIALLGLAGCREEIPYDRLRGRGTTHDMRQPGRYDGGGDQRLLPDADGDALTLDARVRHDAPRLPPDAVADVPQRADGILGDGHGDGVSYDARVRADAGRPDAPPDALAGDGPVLPPDAGVGTDAPPVPRDSAVPFPDAVVGDGPVTPPPDRGLDGLVADAGEPNLIDFMRPYDCDPATIALYHFDDPSPLEDACGANDLTNTGTTGIDGQNVVFGQARALTSGAYLSAPDSPDFDLADGFTVEGWIRPTAYPVSVGYIAAKNNAASGGRQWYIFMNPTGQINVGKIRDDCDGPGTEDNMASVSSLPLDTWTHVRFSYDQRERVMRLSLNGVLDNSILLGPGAASLCSDTDSPFRIGAVGNAPADLPFTGDVDEFRVSSINRDYTP